MLLLGKFTFKIADKKLIFLLGIANGVGYLLQYVAMGNTSAAKAALFINLSAIWVVILSPKLLGESFSRKKIVGVFFAFAGIIFVSTNLDFSTMVKGQLVADMMLIISGVVWAIFMIYNKKLITHSISATFQSMTWVLIFTFFSIVPFTVLARPGFFSLSGWAWAGIVYTAIVCWVIPYYMWLEGLKHLSASTSTLLLLSEIVIATILSIIILKEPVTVFSTIGALFIIISIALVSIKDKTSA
jgi:drug/metabolite transporter (DMT)-like permease